MERGEGVGENVGYTIRLESRGGPGEFLLVQLQLMEL